MATKTLLFARNLVRAALPLKGGKRLAGVIERLTSGCKREVLIEDFDGDLRFFCALGQHMGSWIFWRGAYSADQLATLNRLLTPTSHFVDIGANHGEFTVFAAKRCAVVHAFEPVNGNLARLNRNIQINGFSNVRVHEEGLSDADGELPIFASEDGHNEGLPTLYRTPDRSKLLQVITLRRLDDVLREAGTTRVDVMKIDVEGAELAVLKGAIETLRRYKPTILMEVNAQTCRAAGYEPEELLRFVTDLGYDVALIAGTKTQPLTVVPPFCNVLATPR
ncbi:FkbM family methyltransferase [Paraburkholderia sp. UCT31]|uniref:FkbM family methyltransferase n=1 Tax=Paraburkholderia sp. UCT31 TaxID=2615209 RepID=UPI0016559B88|nr:FkbM family methyltransferase [Paraburkholderia sp. UCT31]MBC8737351.1 FkbM family methyltransferase [Paraburkholderia sp. UCT31]